MENSLDHLLTGAAAPQPQNFTPEEFAARKKLQREAVYAMVEATTMAVCTDGQRFRDYLNVQARFDRYSVTNALLILAQCPEATQLRDFDGWREKGAMVGKGQKAISILEPGKQYTTLEGHVGTYYNVKSVFDISQTNAARPESAPRPEARGLVSALIAKRPVPIGLVDRLSTGAYYDAANRTIVARKGMEFNTLFCCVSNALAKAEIHRLGGDPNTELAAFDAYCASYLMTRKYGLDVSRYSFPVLPEALGDPRAARAELSRIREVFHTLAVRTDRGLAGLDKAVPSQAGTEVR